MPDTQEPQGGSVKNTSIVSGSTAIGGVLATFAAHPTWPPPESITILAIGAAAPFIHLVGRGIYRRLARWAGEPETLTSAKTQA